MADKRLVAVCDILGSSTLILGNPVETVLSHHRGSK